MTARSPDRSLLADPLGADALDFWLGSWIVSWADGGHGTNTIRRILDDQGIEESFDGSDPDVSLLGRSLSVRDTADGRWRQTWIDSTGAYLDFAAVVVEGRISFQRETIVNGVAVVQRMVWLDVSADAFRWQWQRSGDGAHPGNLPGRSTTGALDRAIVVRVGYVPWNSGGRFSRKARMPSW